MKYYDYSQLWMEMANRGMRDKDLAKIAKISIATVSRMRKGKPIAASTMYRICASVGCPVEWLIKSQDEITNTQQS